MFRILWTYVLDIEIYFYAEMLAYKKYPEVREQEFQMIYEFTGNGDLAGYVSDDFGLIADAKLLGYEDLWLNKLCTCYENRTIPCGSL